MNNINNKDTRIPTAVHGGNIIAAARELGCSPADLIDMSSNLTPLGLPSGLREALAGRLDEIGFLPEAGSETLCRCLAERNGLKRGELQVGNGTTEFIYLVPEVLGLKRAVVVEPTYADYRQAVKWCGMKTEGFRLDREDDFRLNFVRLGRMLRGGEIVFICNPNNPTGVLTPSARLYDFIKDNPESVFLVDESYLPFVREPSLVQFPRLDNLFVLSSFSKIYGIVGLRLGALASSEANMAMINARRRPWGVNRLAQVAGEFLVQHGGGYIESVRKFMETHMPSFKTRLNALPGVRAVPGAANFVLCRLAGQPLAPLLHRRMLAKGIIIRNCETVTGLDGHYFRLSIKDEKNNNLCIKALGDILEDLQ